MMDQPDVDQRLRTSKNVHARLLGEQVVLLDFANGDFFALDAVGAVVWDALTRGASIRQLAEAVAARYDVTVSVAIGDVAALVRELRMRALVVAD